MDSFSFDLEGEEIWTGLTPVIVQSELTPLFFFPQDPTAASISDRDCDTREGETVAMNYKPSPLQVKLGRFSVQKDSRNDVVFVGFMMFTNLFGFLMETWLKFLWQHGVDLDYTQLVMKGQQLSRHTLFSSQHTGELLPSCVGEPAKLPLYWTEILFCFCDFIHCDLPSLLSMLQGNRKVS